MIYMSNLARLRYGGPFESMRDNTCSPVYTNYRLHHLTSSGNQCYSRSKRHAPSQHPSTPTTFRNQTRQYRTCHSLQPTGTSTIRSTQFSHFDSLTTFSNSFRYSSTSFAPSRVKSLLFPSNTTYGTESTPLPACSLMSSFVSGSAS